jgi:protein-export membrane protein SecD
MKKSSIIFFSFVLAIALMATYAVFGLQMGSVKLNSVIEDVKLGLDIEGGVVVVFEAQTDLEGDALKALMEQTKTVINKRINVIGLTEPNVTIQGTNRIRVELPGVENAEDALRSIGKTAQLKYVVIKEGQVVMQGETYDEAKGDLIFTGERIKEASVSGDSFGQPAVSFVLDTEGATLFREATLKTSQMPNPFPSAENPRGGQIAIVLDNQIISAPTASVIINDGRSIITGNFTYDEATELTNLIRGGSLPSQLVEVQSSIIGPTLGKDALHSSIFAAQLGFLFVIVFMIVYYRVPGAVASVSLILYATLILTIMVAMKATLTLPGIAGIVLSVGMAVDANVIIFERIKEELRAGKSLRASIEHGFHKAMKTILDSNITTLIATVILFYFGEGPIKGFAVTLMIGIVTSMFTAIVITQIMLKQVVNSNWFKNIKAFGA